MPRLERDDLILYTEDDGIQMVRDGSFLTQEDARWLMTAALPTLLNALSGPESVPDAIRQGYRDVREAG